MIATQDSIPSFKLIVKEWDTLCILADSPPSSTSSNRSRFTRVRNKNIWEVVDKSLPIILDGDTWFVRILEHKLKGLHLDIRKFELKTDGNREWFEPSEEGLCIKLGNLGKLFDPIIKLFKKWKGKI